MKKKNRWFRLSLVLVVALLFNIGIANVAMAEKDSPVKIGIVDIGKGIQGRKECPGDF